MTKGKIEKSALELTYEKWDEASGETRGPTVTCSDQNVLGGIVKSITWNLKVSILYVQDVT